MKNESLIRIRSILQSLPNDTFLVSSSPDDSRNSLLSEEMFEFHLTGKGKTELFQIFPGIILSLNQFLADQMTFHSLSESDILVVTHCQSGRIQADLGPGSPFAFGEGDLFLLSNTYGKDLAMTFPLGYYEGISIFINPEKVHANLLPVLKDSSLNPDLWKRPFPPPGKSSIFPARPDINCIFRPLYDLPADLRMSYFKLKIQELFLYLSRLSSNTGKADSGTIRQILLMQQIHQQLTAHPERRYTIEELSRQHLINTSTLKEAFKSVYGMPIATYMKEYRIRKAMELLLNTDKSIAEISAGVGYETQGKFTKAFKEFTHMTPSNYRKNYRTGNSTFSHLD